LCRFVRAGGIAAVNYMDWDRREMMNVMTIPASATRRPTATIKTGQIIFVAPSCFPDSTAAPTAGQ